LRRRSFQPPRRRQQPLRRRRPRTLPLRTPARAETRRGAPNWALALLSRVAPTCDAIGMSISKRALPIVLVLAAGAAPSAQPPASITISGGVSLGSYEAGLVYYIVEVM